MNELAEQLTKNLIGYAKDYVIIENGLRIFPLLPGDVVAMVRYTDSHHVRMQLFNRLIETRTLETIDNHKIVKKLINIDPTILNGMDLVLQKGLIDMIKEINEQWKNK